MERTKIWENNEQTMMLTCSDKKASYDGTTALSKRGEEKLLQTTNIRIKKLYFSLHFFLCILAMQQQFACHCVHNKHYFSHKYIKKYIFVSALDFFLVYADILRLWGDFVKFGGHDWVSWIKILFLRSFTPFGVKFWFFLLNFTPY